MAIGSPFYFSHILVPHQSCERNEWNIVLGRRFRR